jgi:hypothetical protein
MKHSNGGRNGRRCFFLGKTLSRALTLARVQD